MGLQYREGEYYYGLIDDNGWYKPSNMKFNYSWDWIMPVFEKIQTLEPNVPGLYIVRTARLGLHTCYIEVHIDNNGWDTKSIDFKKSGYKTVKCVYDVCVEFINYYNEKVYGNTNLH